MRTTSVIFVAPRYAVYKTKRIVYFMQVIKILQSHQYFGDFFKKNLI